MPDDSPWFHTDGDWDEPYPAEKLWVHPDIADRYPAEVLCSQAEIDDAAPDDDIGAYDDAIGFICPGAGCEFDVAVPHALRYIDLEKAKGVMRCPECEMAWFAAKWPPDPIDPNGGSGTP